MKIKPLNKHVLILIERKPETTKSGIIIASADDPRSERGEVVALDEKISGIKVGDIVFFKSYALKEVEYENKLYGFLKEDEILAKHGALS